VIVYQTHFKKFNYLIIALLLFGFHSSYWSNVCSILFVLFKVYLF